MRYTNCMTLDYHEISTLNINSASSGVCCPLRCPRGFSLLSNSCYSNCGQINAYKRGERVRSPQSSIDSFALFVFRNWSWVTANRASGNSSHYKYNSKKSTSTNLGFQDSSYFPWALTPPSCWPIELETNRTGVGTSRWSKAWAIGLTCLILWSMWKRWEERQMGSRAQPEEKHRGGLRRGEGKQRRRTEGKKGRQKRRKEETDSGPSLGTK